MNSLQSATAPNETSTTNSDSRNASKYDIQGENDLEDEDEQWHNSLGKEKRPGSSNNVAEDGSSEQAPTALSSTFRKARSNDGYAESQKDEPATRLSDLPPPPNEAIQKQVLLLNDSSLGRTWRRETSVTLSSLRNRSSSQIGGCCWTIDPVLQFSQLDDVLPPAAMTQLTSEYPSPTTVQSQAISVALAGRDALVTAATGQGKTLAYILSALCHLTRQPKAPDPGVIILVPTRELALQVEKQSKKIISACDMTLRSVLGGGQGKWKLVQELKRSTHGTQVVVATPGRLLDVVSTKGGLSLQTVSFVVLDEADKMIQMGFTVQVRKILERIRSDRQTLMLSATMGRKVEQLTLNWLQPDAMRISVGRTGESSRNVNQHVVVLPSEEAKVAFLVEMVPVFQGLGRSIVFVATREGCETLASTIREQTGVLVLTLHADKHQVDRNSAVKSFRKGDVTLLVATDLAARGLDITNVQTVVSFDPAKNLDSHVHRVGRAGRLSKETSQSQAGSAYTLLTHRNKDFASILLNAFQREGREISPELSELAAQGRSSSGGKPLARGQKFGLGFNSQDDGSNGHYGPPAKRSRWG